MNQRRVLLQAQSSQMTHEPCLSYSAFSRAPHPDSGFFEVAKDMAVTAVFEA